MGRRRSSSGVTDFLSDIVDDIKDFVDDEVIDRGRDTERDLRRASRNWTDDDDRRSRSRNGSSRDSRATDDDTAELRRAIRTLARKIDALVEARSGSGSGAELPIAGYDDLTAAEIGNKLAALSQAELAEVDRYEREHANRSTITGRIETLRGSEPWSGYDDQTVVDIRKALADADDQTARAVRTYEAAHKNRQGVLDAASATQSS